MKSGAFGLFPSPNLNNQAVFYRQLRKCLLQAVHWAADKIKSFCSVFQRRGTFCFVDLKAEPMLNPTNDPLGCFPTLFPADVDVPSPDEKSVITYVSSIYDAFPKIPEGGEGISANVGPALPKKCWRRSFTVFSLLTDERLHVTLKCYLLQTTNCVTSLFDSLFYYIAFFLLTAGGGSALVRLPVEVFLSAPVEPPAYCPHGQQKLPTKPSGT